LVKRSFGVGETGNGYKLVDDIGLFKLSDYKALYLKAKVCQTPLEHPNPQVAGLEFL
jgi:hypothetical protein